MPRTLSHHPEAVRTRERRARLHAPQPPPIVLRPFARIAALRPNAITTPWRLAPCPHCGARLLSAEDSKWCCRNGTKLLPALPTLPPRIHHLAANQSPLLNVLSRRLNYLFCMSAIGVSGKFTEYHGKVSHCVLLRLIANGL